MTPKHQQQVCYAIGAIIGIMVFGLIMSCNIGESRHDKFVRYVDSINVHRAKWICYMDCNKLDSAEYEHGFTKRFSDSMNKYYCCAVQDSIDAPKKTNKCNCR